MEAILGVRKPVLVVLLARPQVEPLIASPQAVLDRRDERDHRRALGSEALVEAAEPVGRLPSRGDEQMRADELAVDLDALEPEAIGLE